MVCTAKQQFAVSHSGEQRDFIDAVARRGSARAHDSSGPRKTDFRSGGFDPNTRAEGHSITRFHRPFARIVTGGHTRMLERVR